jgi:hypothetical protein
LAVDPVLCGEVYCFPEIGSDVFTATISPKIDDSRFVAITVTKFGVSACLGGVVKVVVHPIGVGNIVLVVVFPNTPGWKY